MLNMGQMGRYGDNTMAHVSTGEMIVPQEVLDKRPDLKGYVNFNGTFYNAAAWVKKGDDGKPFYQMSIEKQQQKKDNVDAGKPDLVVNDDFNELPF